MNNLFPSFPVRTLLLALATMVLCTFVRGEPTAPKPETKADAAGKPAATPLKPYEVAVPAKLAFGISLDVFGDTNTKKLVAIYITDVRKESDAERNGLLPFSRVVRINGKRVEEFEPSFAKGSELNQLFVKRKKGEFVTLEVVPPREKKTQVVKIYESHIFDPEPLRDLVP